MFNVFYLHQYLYLIDTKVLELPHTPTVKINNMYLSDIYIYKVFITVNITII